MRLTAVIIFLAAVQVSASSFGQKVTYLKKDVALVKLFKEIKKQTGYNVVWYEETLDASKIISARFKDASIEEVMGKALSGMQLAYTISKNTIVIKEKERSFLDKISDAIHSIVKDIDVRGKITDEYNKPLKGATVKIKGTTRSVITDENGNFYFENVKEKAVLVISYLGYKSMEIEAAQNLNGIQLVENHSELVEVQIVSTGYQTLPKERATGSFTLIDNKTFDRAVSPDLLSRLKGITNGLLFDSTTGNPEGISIRGRSTIFSNTKPLIVVDNFPFEGDLNTLNPNDIENVTLLKDAAAASIWGVRAGNGVIVVSTKKGKQNQRTSIEFNTNLTIGNKPNLFYQPQLSSSEFIDVEKFLFDKGAYNATIDDGYSTVSPVVAILQKMKLDPSYSSQGQNEINALRNIDVRDQIDKYFYRKSSRQQYYIALNGGSLSQTYRFSAGYDKNLANAVSISDSRFTIKGNNTYILLDNKLRLSTDITFSKSKNENTNTQRYLPYTPYDQIIDAVGNSLSVVRAGGLRKTYTDTAGNGNLLDWKYRPLDELQKKYSHANTNLTDYRLNVGVSYKIISPLTFSVNYQYYGANMNNESSYDQASFYTRDLINTYSRINTMTGAVTRPIPIGDIYSPNFITNQSNYGRFQMDFIHMYGAKHQVSAIAGYEIRDDRYKYNGMTLYGYNPKTATNSQVDLITPLPFYYGSNIQAIGNNTSQQSSIDRYISYYANASYSYDDKYILSGSYRKDESNLFGVKANQKGVPLWSAGVAWNVSKEHFFDQDWLSSLQLKATYGYNGNLNKTVSAYLTAMPETFANAFNTNYYVIVNPPNENLRWERVQNINFGLYFSTKDERISGSLEYFVKNGVDLIGSSPIAPQTGIINFTGNTADTHTNGMDIQINSKNLTGKFNWTTIAIFDFAKDKITDYKVTTITNSTVVNATNSAISPVPGYPINSIFAYKWAGLDALGNPKGIFNNNQTTDYTSIINSLDRSQLDYFGSATPVFFGSLRNTFTYKMVEFSFNLAYKFKYFFRANSINYYNLYLGGYMQSDYSNRWQKPGDELITNVPSAVYPADGNREDFYRSSAVLVEHGDHIRLQDIQLNFNLSKSRLKQLPLQSLNIYFYATNLGIIWRANKKGLDPDQLLAPYPAPKTFSLGLKATF